MGIPIIHSAQDFRAFAKGVHSRKDFVQPYAFGIGAVKFDKKGELIETQFPKVNVGENQDFAAAFADVVHHRFGNVVCKIGFEEFVDLEYLFLLFSEETDMYPNVQAFHTVCRLSNSPQYMTPVIVFVGSLDDYTCHDNPIYLAFLERVKECSTAA